MKGNLWYFQTRRNPGELLKNDLRDRALPVSEFAWTASRFACMCVEHLGVTLIPQYIFGYIGWPSLNCLLLATISPRLNFSY